MKDSRSKNVVFSRFVDRHMLFTPNSQNINFYTQTTRPTTSEMRPWYALTSVRIAHTIFWPSTAKMHFYLMFAVMSFILENTNQKTQYNPRQIRSKVRVMMSWCDQSESLSSILEKYWRLQIVVVNLRVFFIARWCVTSNAHL